MRKGVAGRPLPGQRQRRHAIEPREGVVGEDQVGAELVELAQEAVPGIHPAGVERNAAPLELVLDELRVHRYVFEDQDPERSRAPCDAPLARAISGRLPGAAAHTMTRCMNGDLPHKVLDFMDITAVIGAHSTSFSLR